MKVKQFYDKALAHGSYAILSEGEIALIDPARDPKPYLDFAEENEAQIIAIFETHPHADFISSHLEFHHNYGAQIYINSKVGVDYPHQPMNDGDEVKFGNVTLKALFTPGHSPDHNSYLLIDEKGFNHSVYTGDSLFVGDVGRPDLREGAGNIQVQREELARQMFGTINNVFKPLEDGVLVYPAHGAGSLCGKDMSEETFSTLGRERFENWAFQLDNEKDFVKALLEDQPFVPKYFPYDVEINRKGSPALEESIRSVPVLDSNVSLDESIMIIDARPEPDFKAGHFEGAINIQDKEGEKFETWLGAIIDPGEPFYLISDSEQNLNSAILKTAKIGYETQIKGGLVAPGNLSIKMEPLDVENFKGQFDGFTIVDIRNPNERQEAQIFSMSINIPLPELRERAAEISKEKPVVVHCAGGYRSAVGASIIQREFKENGKVFDLSEAVNDFKEN